MDFRYENRLRNTEIEILSECEKVYEIAFGKEITEIETKRTKIRFKNGH